jgi:ribosomal protein S18 acetylase RimI-like enzyme
MTQTTHTIRRLGPADAQAHRTIRLESLRLHPEAYSSSFEDEVGWPLTVFAERLAAPPPNATFGGFHGETLVGVVRLYVPAASKQRHRGHIVGVYVDAAHRRSGLAQNLMARVIAEARQYDLTAATLAVSVGNHAARALYVQLVFKPYGLDRRAMKLGDAYVDEELMVLDLN